MLESATDLHNLSWWSRESTMEASPRRNSSFGRVNGYLSEFNMEPDGLRRDLGLTLEGAKKKLTWISREDHRISSRNSVVNDRPSIQNCSVHARSARFGVLDSPGRGIYNPPESPALQSGSAYGRSARFGVLDSPRRGFHNPESPALQSGSVYGRSARFGVLDSPGRGFHNPPESLALQSGSAYGRSARFGVLDSPGRGFHNVPESPARRGESVRQIRTPSVDFHKTEVAGSATPPPRRLRSVNQFPRCESFQEASVGAKSDHNVAREANAIRRVSSSSAACDQRTGPKPSVQPPIEETPSFSRIIYSPESDRMVSYLAEETINAGTIKPGRIRKLNLHSLHSNAVDQLRMTDHERSSAGEARISNIGERRHASNSFHQIDKKKAERVDSHDKHRDHRVGGIEHESDFYASRSGTASLPSDGCGPTRTISASMENYLESRTQGSNMGSRIIVSTKQALPSLTPASSHPNLSVRSQTNLLENPSTSSKIGLGSRHDSFTAYRAALSPLNGNEDVTTTTTSLSQSKEEYREDPNRGRRKGYNVESVQVQGENGFPSRLQYWAEFLGKDEMDSTEGRRRLTQQTEERTAPSGRTELGTKIAPVWLHSNGARGHFSQEGRQIDSNGRHPAARVHSQRYEDVGRSLLSDKARGGNPREKYNSSRRWQSCRRDLVVNSLLESSQESEAVPPVSNKLVKSSELDTSLNSKSSNSVDMHLSSSSDTIQEHYSFLAQVEKARSVFKDSRDPRSSRWPSVAVPESGENSLQNSGDLPLQEPSPFPTQTNKPNYQLTYSQPKSSSPHMDSPPLDSQLTQKKKNSPQLERPKMLHKKSLSFDEDVYKKLFAQMKDNDRIIPTVSTSTSVSQQACSTKPPRPPSPGAIFQKWIASHFKLGSKASNGKTRQPQEEEKLSKKSPWRTRPAEFFQGITRRKGSSTRAPGASLLDTHGLQNLRRGSLSETQSPFNSPDAWQRRLLYAEAGSNSTPPHRNSYLLPAIASFSPAHSKRWHNLVKNRNGIRREVPHT